MTPLNLLKGTHKNTDSRPVALWEPPSADPHVRWREGWGRKTPGYPIGA